LHNSEEWIWMPGWMQRHADRLPWAVTAVQFRFGLLVLTVAAFAVTWLSAGHGKQSIWSYMVFGYIVAMLVNVFVPHLPASILFWGYTPGVITAVFVNLPMMSALAVAALRQGWVAERKALAFAVAVPLGIAACVPLLFWIGGLI
jgi:hypothetical protein